MLVGAAGAGFVGSSALLGWVLGIDLLKSIVPGDITMKPNTAIAFVAFACALIASARPDLRSGRLADAFATSSVALASVVGLQYVLGVDFGIDQALFREPAGAIGTVHPGRMSPQTTMSFVLLGASLMAARRRRFRHLVLVCATMPALLGALNLFDHFLGAATPTFLRGYTQMAVPTSAAFVVAALAVVDLGGASGLLQTLRGGTEAAKLAYRLLAAALIIPVFVAWLRLAGERAGLYDTAYGVSLATLALIVVFVAVIARSTRRLSLSEAKRASLEAEAHAARRVAEDANHAKTEFLSRMSHELRTPLNAILGFAQLLEFDRLTGRQSEYVRYIRRGGDQLLELINEVLDISRIESGTMALSTEPVLVRDVVEEQLSLIAPLAKARSIEVAVTPDSPVSFVLADRQRLRQVVLNLLSNAVKYNRSGGRVTVAWREADLGRIAIEVSDTGQGIAPADIERVFLPFERLGAERASVEGTGIGLTLTRRLVEHMGGRIDVESRLGSGSTFTVELAATAGPMQQPRLAALEERSLASAPVVRKDVLYVEDNPSNIRLIEQVIQQRPGVRLLTAMHARLGLDLARDNRPDLILLDLHLPDMPGEQALAELRGDPATRDIPAVILSADVTPGQQDRLLSLGAAAFLSKPLDVAAFLRLLDGVPGRLPATVALGGGAAR